MSPVTQFNNAPQDPAMKKKNYGPLVLLVTLAFAVVTFYGTVRSTDSVDIALAAKVRVRTPGPGSTVCGDKRFSPQGNVAIGNISQFHHKKPQFVLVSDENKGPDSKEYNTYCRDVPHFKKDEGGGDFSDYAIGQCNDPKGCELWRSFDEDPEDHVSSRRLSSSTLTRSYAKGAYWTLEQDLRDDSGKGKTLSKYDEDQGVCKWQFAYQKGTDKQGNEGGYMVKCTLPVGHLFAFGPGQSMDCLDKDGNDRTIPKSKVIQVYVDSYNVSPLKDCSYYHVKDYDPLTRDAPDITKGDGKWKDVDIYKAENRYMLF